MSNNNSLLIAVSGKSGCGNSTVSRLLADTLKLRLLNYTFRDMARDRGMSFKELRARAEKDFSWDRELDIYLARTALEGNCVLASRMAVWLVPQAHLKVFLDVPAEIRAGRIAGREGKPYEETLEETRERDRLDSARYWQLYNIDNSVCPTADLIVDNSSLSPEETVRLILETLKSRKNMPLIP